MMRQRLFTSPLGACWIALSLLAMNGTWAEPASAAAATQNSCPKELPTESASEFSSILKKLPSSADCGNSSCKEEVGKLLTDHKWLGVVKWVDAKTGCINDFDLEKCTSFFSPKSEWLNRYYANCEPSRINAAAAVTPNPPISENTNLKNILSKLNDISEKLHALQNSMPKQNTDGLGLEAVKTGLLVTCTALLLVLFGLEVRKILGSRSGAEGSGPSDVGTEERGAEAAGSVALSPAVEARLNFLVSAATTSALSSALETKFQKAVARAAVDSLTSTLETKFGNGAAEVTIGVLSSDLESKVRDALREEFRLLSATLKDSLSGKPKKVELVQAAAPISAPSAVVNAENSGQYAKASLPHAPVAAPIPLPRPSSSDEEICKALTAALAVRSKFPLTDTDSILAHFRHQKLGVDLCALVESKELSVSLLDQFAKESTGYPVLLAFRLLKNDWAFVYPVGQHFLQIQTWFDGGPGQFTNSNLSAKVPAAARSDGVKFNVIKKGQLA